MAWAKIKDAGAPKGNKNKARGVRMQQALNVALELESRATGQNVMVELFRGVIQVARNPDTPARDMLACVQEIVDRYAGKTTQVIDATVASTVTHHAEGLSATDQWLGEAIAGAADSEDKKPVSH